MEDGDGDGYVEQHDDDDDDVLLLLMLLDGVSFCRAPSSSSSLSSKPNFKPSIMTEMRMCMASSPGMTFERTSMSV